MMSKLTPELRAAFAAVADMLIPAYKKYPSATSVGVHEKMLDDVLGFRPDLVEAFVRGLKAIDTAALSDSVNTLYKADSDAFNAISLVASGGYYMTPQVREVLGYPGQESVAYNAHEVPDFLLDQRLENVTRRGPIYRSTPAAR
jgi:hypothetical protein